LDFHLGHAGAVLFLALAATGATEHAREMIRKPYTVGQYMFSNGVRRSEVAKWNDVGFTSAAIWSQSDMDRGELMFRGQCMDCHTLDGYRSMRRLLHGRDHNAITNVVTMLHESPATSPYRNFMPPLVGTNAEIQDLIGYLDGLGTARAGGRVVAQSH
jgi:cytochrome bd ubiquinol oxidase subunit I